MAAGDDAEADGVASHLAEHVGQNGCHLRARGGPGHCCWLRRGAEGRRSSAAFLALPAHARALPPARFAAGADGAAIGARPRGGGCWGGARGGKREGVCEERVGTTPLSLDALLKLAVRLWNG